MDSYDLIVIGAGPGGYVASIRAAQLGMSVACVEKDATLGGTCLNVGCIPSKALLESSEKYTEAAHGLKAHGINVGELNLDLGKMLGRKDKIVKQLTGGVAMLFRKNKIASLNGIGRFTGKREGDKHVIEVVGQDGAVAHTVAATKVLIATGSRRQSGISQGRSGSLSDSTCSSHSSSAVSRRYSICVNWRISSLFAKSTRAKRSWGFISVARARSSRTPSVSNADATRARSKGRGESEPKRSVSGEKSSAESAMTCSNCDAKVR